MTASPVVSQTKPAATVEVAYSETPRSFWAACRDGAAAYADLVPGVQAAEPDNARQVLVLTGTRVGTRKAADRIALLWPAAVGALRQQGKASPGQHQTTEGRTARRANEHAYLTAFVASGGVL